jgi:hypothetical protein
MSDRKDPEKLAAENRVDNPENNGKAGLSARCFRIRLLFIFA